MALTPMTCPDCNGTGLPNWTFIKHFSYCIRCMGVGEIEVQIGPEDEDGEVPDPPRSRIPGATDPWWQEDGEGEGEVLLPF